MPAGLLCSAAMEHDAAESPPDDPSDFSSPALLWWVSIPLGMGLTGALALSAGAHALMPAPMGAILTPTVMRIIFVVAVGLHVLEGSYAMSRAKMRGLPAAAWGAQTLLLGYPSLRLLLRRTRDGARAGAEAS